MNRRRTRADGDQLDRRSAKESKHKFKLKKTVRTLCDRPSPPTQSPANNAANNPTDNDTSRAANTQLNDSLDTDITEGSPLASLIPTRRDLFGKGIEDYVFDLIDLCRSTGIIKPAVPRSGDTNSSSSGYCGDDDIYDDPDITNLTDPFFRHNIKNNPIVYSCHGGTCPAGGCDVENCPHRQLVCTRDNCPSRERGGASREYCDDNNCYWRKHRFGRHRRDVLSRAWTRKNNKTRNIQQDDRSEDSDDKLRLVYSKDWEKRRVDKRSRKGKKRGKKRDEKEWCDDTDDVSRSEENDWESDEKGVQRICRGAIDILKDLFVGPTLDDLVFSAIGEVGEWMSGAYNTSKYDDNDGDEGEEKKPEKRGGMENGKNKEDNKKLEGMSEKIDNGDKIIKPKGKKRNSEVDDWHRAPTNEQRCPNCHGNNCCTCRQSVVDILAKISEEMLNHTVPCLCEQDNGVGDHACTLRENSSEENVPLEEAVEEAETVPCQCAEGNAQCNCKEEQDETLQHIVKALEECTGRSTSGRDDRIEAWSCPGDLRETEYQCECMQQNVECYCVTLPDNHFRAQPSYQAGCSDTCPQCCRNACDHGKPPTSSGGTDVIQNGGAQNLNRENTPFSCAVNTRVFLARPKSLDRSDRRYYLRHNDEERRPCNCSKSNGKTHRRTRSLDVSTHNGCHCASRKVDILKPCACSDRSRADAVENETCKCWDNQIMEQGTCYCPTQTSPVVAGRRRSFGCESIPEENSDPTMDVSTVDGIKSSLNTKRTSCSCSSTHEEESKSCHCSSMPGNNTVMKPNKKPCTCFSSFQDQTFLEKSHKPAEVGSCKCPNSAAEDGSCHCPKPVENKSCHCPKPAEDKACHCPKPAEDESCHCPKPVEDGSCHCPKPAEDKSCHCPKPAENKSYHCPKPVENKSRHCPKLAENKSCHCPKPAENEACHCPKPVENKSCHCPKPAENKSCHCPKPAENKSCHCPKPAENEACHCPKPAENKSCHCPKPAENKACHCPKPAENEACHCPKPAENKSCHCPKPAENKACHCPKPAENKSCHCPKPAENESCHCPKPVENKSCHCPKLAEDESCHCPELLEEARARCNCYTSPKENQVAMKQNETRQMCFKCLCNIPTDVGLQHPIKSQDADHVTEKQHHDSNKRDDAKCECPQKVGRSIKNRSKFSSKRSQQDDTRPENPTEEDRACSEERSTEDMTNFVEDLSDSSVENTEFIDSAEKIESKHVRTSSVNRSNLNKRDNRNDKSNVPSEDPKNIRQKTTRSSPRCNSTRARDPRERMDEDDSGSSLENDSLENNRKTSTKPRGIEQSDRKRLLTPKQKGSFSYHDDSHTDMRDRDAVDEYNRQKYSSNNKGRRPKVVHKSIQTDSCGKSREGSVKRLNERSRSSRREKSDDSIHSTPEDSSSQEVMVLTSVREGSNSEIDNKQYRGPARSTQERSHSLPRRRSGEVEKRSSKYESSRNEKKLNVGNENSDNDMEKKSHRGSVRSANQKPHLSSGKRSSRVKVRSAQNTHLSEEEISAVVLDDSNGDIVKKSHGDSVRRNKKESHSSPGKRSSGVEKRSSKHASPLKDKKSNITHEDGDMDIEKESHRKTKEMPHSSPKKRCGNIENKSSKQSSIREAKKSNEAHGNRNSDIHDNLHGSSVQSVHEKPYSSSRKKSSKTKGRNSEHSTFSEEKISTLDPVPENSDRDMEDNICRSSVLSANGRPNSSSRKNPIANNDSKTEHPSAPGNRRSNIIDEEIQSPSQENSSETSSSSNDGMHSADMHDSIEEINHSNSSMSTDSMSRSYEDGCNCVVEEDLGEHKSRDEYERNNEDRSGNIKSEPCACSVAPPRREPRDHDEDIKGQHRQMTVKNVTYRSVSSISDMNCGIGPESMSRDNSCSAEQGESHLRDDGNTGQRHQSTKANVNHKRIHSITDKDCGLKCDSTECLSSFSPNHKEPRWYDEDITGKHHQSTVANVSNKNVIAGQYESDPNTDMHCRNVNDGPEQDSSLGRSTSDMHPQLSHTHVKLNSSETPSTETESSFTSMNEIVKRSEQYSSTSYIERQSYENKTKSKISESPKYVESPRNASHILPEDLKNAIESIVCKSSQVSRDDRQYMCSQEIINAIEKNACKCRYAPEEERSTTSPEIILQAIRENACKCKAGVPEEKPYMSPEEILRQIDDKVQEAVLNSRKDRSDYEVLIRRERQYVDEKIQEIISTRSEAVSTPVIVQPDKNIDREDFESLLKEERKYIDERVNELMAARPVMVSTGTTVEPVPTVAENTGTVMVSVGTMIDMEGKVDVVKWLHEEYLTLAKDIIESKNMPEGYEGPLSQDNLRLRQENLASLESILVPKLSVGKMDPDKYVDTAKGSTTDRGSASGNKRDTISVRVEKSSKHTRHESLRSRMSARSHFSNSRSKSLDEGLKKSVKSKDMTSSSGKLSNTKSPITCQDVCGSVHRSSLKGTRSICLQGKCPSHCPSITWSDSKTIRQEINGHPIDLKVPINEKKHCLTTSSRSWISQEPSYSRLSSKEEARVSNNPVRDQLNTQYDTNRSSSGFIGRNERSIKNRFGSSDLGVELNGSKHSAGKQSWRVTSGSMDTGRSENNSTNPVGQSTIKKLKVSDEDLLENLQEDSLNSVNESTEEVKKQENSGKLTRRQYSALSIQRQSAVDIMPENEIPTNDGHRNERTTLESNSLMNLAFGGRQRTESPSQESRVQNDNRKQPGELLESIPTKRRPSEETSLKHASSAPQGKIRDDVRYKRRSWSASRPDIWTRHQSRTKRNEEIHPDYGRKEIPSKFSSAEIKFIKPYDKQYLKTINSVSKGDIYLEKGKCGCSVLVQEIESIPSNSKGDVVRCKCSKTNLRSKKRFVSNSDSSDMLKPDDSDHQSYAILQYNPTNCKNAACPFSPRREHANNPASRKICREAIDPDRRNDRNGEDYSSHVDVYEELDEDVSIHEISETRHWTRDEHSHEELGTSTSNERLAYQLPKISRNRNVFTAQRDSCCSGQPNSRDVGRRKSSKLEHGNRIKTQYKQFSTKNHDTEVIEGINFSPLFHRLESTAVDCKEKLKNYYQTLMGVIPKKEIHNKKCKGFPIKKSKSGYCIISEGSSPSLFGRDCDRDAKPSRSKDGKQTVWAVVKIKVKPDGTKVYDIMRPKPLFGGDVTQRQFVVDKSSVMVTNVGSGGKRRGLDRKRSFGRNTGCARHDVRFECLDAR